MLPRSPWRTRGTSCVVAAAVAALVLAGGGPAAADPSDQPGGTSGVLDSQALDELQKRAAEVQTGLQAQQGEVVAAARRPDPGRAGRRRRRRRSSTTPRASSPATSRSSPATRRRSTGTAARLTPLTLLLSGGDPGDVLSAMGFLDVVDAHAAQVIGAAETQRQAALDAAAAGRRRPSTRRRRAQDEVAARGRRARGEGGRGHRRARRRAGRRRQAAGAAAAGAGRRQHADGGQLEGLRRPADRGRGRRRPRPRSWRTRRPGCPRAWCRSPPRAGERSAGRPSCRASPRRCWCCPAETLAAVTAAMDALGLPYAPGTAGPESWDCGSLVQSVYGAAGISLPATQADLFAVTTPVAARRRAARRPRLPRAPPRRGSGTWASRWTRRRCSPPTRGPARSSSAPCRRDQVLGIGRPSLGAAGAGGRPRPDRRRAAHGVRQHRLPAELRRRPAVGRLSQRAHPAERACARSAWPATRCAATPRPPTGRCRRPSRRRSARRSASPTPTAPTPARCGSTARSRRSPRCPAPATTAGGWRSTSAAASSSYGTAQYAWMKANAGRFGFLHPDWAEPGNGREEPWHWEYAGT